MLKRYTLRQILAKEKNIFHARIKLPNEMSQVIESWIKIKVVHIMLSLLSKEIKFIHDN